MTTSSSSISSSASAPLLVNGLISGINTTQVIQALLSAYQAPITDLQNEQTSLTGEASDYRTLNTDMQAVLSASQGLNTSSAWNLMTATTSDSSVASATASPGAQAGSLAFTVNQLAQANTLLSNSGVSSENAIVTSSPSVLAATGGASVGFSGLAASGSLALGSHTITVTQSSAAATVTSGSALGSSTTITSGVNDTLQVDVGGSTFNATIAPGTYSAGALLAKINSALSNAGAPVSASLSSSGALVFATNEQGSAATLSVTGGDALASLGLTTGQSGTGTNAVVDLDGTATTLSTINAGGTVTLAAPSGGIEATIAASPGASGALVQAGSASAALVSTGNGSLTDLIANLNGSGLSLSASAVDDAVNGERLQVAADTTGLDGSVTIDPGPLSGGPLGAMTTIAAAQNATVSVGGANGYTLNSSTDTFSNLMAGTTVTVATTGDASVTVSPDASGEASVVSSLVGATNQALSDINNLAGYNASTKSGGPLLGAAAVENLRNALLSALATGAGTSSLGSTSAAGISLNSDGTVSFDQAKFESAFSAHPSAVAALFTQGATFTPAGPAVPGQVSLVYASNTTVPGSYNVSISQSATQATELGSVLSGGTVTANENLSITDGSNSASYDVTAGQSVGAIANGLNSSFSANGLSVTAFVVGGNQLELASTGYGSAQSFSVTSSAPGTGTTGLGGASAGEPATFSGTDVSGTINGVAGTGVGQVLSAPTDDPVLQGLALLVTTPGISASTSLGSVTYSPGLAQQLASVAQSASDPSVGALTNEISSLTSQSQGLNGQISSYTQLEEQQQTLLQNQFAQMEATLGNLKNEGSALTSQINNLSGF